MKKRVLSLFMALALSFSMTPTVAFAEEAGAATEQEAQSGEGTADVYSSGEDAIGNDFGDDTTAGNITGDVSGGDVSGGDAEQDAAVRAVQAAQALIDALPDEVTAENADELQAQLIAIGKAMEALDEAQLAKLDMARYENICAALATFVAVQDSGTTHVNHTICGATTCEGHNDGNSTHEVVTGWIPLSWDDSKGLLKDGEPLGDKGKEYYLYAGNYYLAGNLTLDAAIVINGEVSLCLNGHSITRSTTASTISIPNTIDNNVKSLSLCDCTKDEVGYITAGASDGVSLGKSSFFNMYGGIIKECGTVGVDAWGTFNMYGGTITTNKGGVVVGGNTFGGTFNMYGGKITANTKSGVCINDTKSKFNMYDGEISGNSADKGGGVYIDCTSDAGTEFNMSGGKISGNKATKGGGVYVHGNSVTKPKFNMSGGEISGNEADDGGGVYVWSYVDFTMSGGEIKGNNTNDSSKPNGNVYVNTAPFYVSGTAKIHDNWINGEKKETGVYDAGYAGSAGNVYIYPNILAYDYIIIAEGLTEDASIGVTTKDKPSDGSPVQFATGASGNLDYTKIFKSDATDTTGTAYDVNKVDEKLYLRLHQHSWNFVQSNQAIEAVCGVDGTKGGSVTIQGPTGNMAYDGNPKAAKLINNTLPDGVKAPEISYTMGDGANNSLPAGSEPTNAGKYTASITLTGVDGKSATASVSFTIGKATPTAADFTVSAPASLVYDGKDKFASITSEKIEQGKFIVSYWDKEGIVVPRNAGTYTVKIKVEGSLNYQDTTDYLTNDAWKFTIEKATPAITITNDSPVILKNGSEVDISDWASFNNTDKDAQLTYELVDTPTGITLADNKLTATSEASAESSFTIKVTAAETANFTVPDAKTITVTVVNKYDAGVSITDAPAVTYGDEFTLTATKNEGTPDDGKWSWSSSNEEILEIVSKGDTATPTIRAKKADTTGATLTATYSCETHEGTATTLFIPVAQKAVSADMIGEISDQTYTGSNIEPTPVITDGSNTLESGKDFTFSYDKNRDAGTATLTITGTGNYMGTASKTFTISPKPIDGADIELEKARFDYNGSEQTVSIKSVTLSDGIQLANTDYVVAEGSNKATNAGYITLTINGTGNYTGTATTTWTIDRIKPVWNNFTCDTNFAEQLTYDGNAKAVTVKVADGIEGMGNITVKYNRSEVAPTDAGRYVVTVDVARGTNYEAESFAIGTLTIKQADAPALKNIEVSYRFTLTGEKTVSVAELVAGASNYMLGTPTGDTGIIEGAPSVDTNGVVKYTLTGKGAIGNKVTLPVTIQSKNYKDATVNVVITLTEKDSQEPLTITGGNTVVYGQTLKLGTTGGSGTGAVTYSIDASSIGKATIDADGVLTPVKVGSVFVKATKAGDAEYNEISSELFEITITQAATTGEPKYAKITTDGKTLADAGLTLNGSTLSPAAGTLEWVDEEGKVLSGDTEVKVNTTYKWRFTPTDTNYNALTGEVELYHEDAPAISAQPVNASVKAGEKAVFEVTATGTNLMYQWKINRNDGKGFVNISGADSASYTSGITDTDCNGFQYYCVISNAAGSVTTDTVTLTVTVQYDILDGADSSWTENTDGSLAIRGSGNIGKFLRVLVDGKVVDPNNYIVTEGSTIITFKPEFLKTLSEGIHSFEIVWTDGTASTSFTVAKNTSGNNGGNNNNNNNNNNSNNDGSNNAGSSANTTDTTIKAPKTGDTSNDALWVVLLAVASVAGLFGFAEIFVRRKKSDCK